MSWRISTFLVLVWLTICTTESEETNFSEDAYDSPAPAPPVTPTPVDRNELEPPPGFARIQGKLLETGNLVVQKSTPAATVYEFYEDYLKSITSGADEQILHTGTRDDVGLTSIMVADPSRGEESDDMIQLLRMSGLTILGNPASGTPDIRFYEACFLAKGRYVHIFKFCQLHFINTVAHCIVNYLPLSVNLGQWMRIPI